MSPVSDYQRMLDSIVSYDEAVSFGADCIEQHALSNWALGDLAARVARLRPDDPLVEEKAATLRKFAAAIGEKYARVRMLAAISHAVPPEDRSPALSHSHYRVLVQAGFERSVLLSWAARAEDLGWNSAALAREVTKVRAGTKRGTQEREHKDALEFLTRGSNLARGVTLRGAKAVVGIEPEEVNRAISNMRYAFQIFADAQADAARSRTSRKRRSNG